MNKIRVIETEQMRSDLPDFSIGDTLKIHYKIIEGKNERVQVFEGLCIAIKRGGIRKTFTVRKISYGVGVERTFPLNSPRIQKIDISRRGRVRRAKLYYIRDRVGKSAKVAELISKKPKKEQAEAKDQQPAESRTAQVGTATAKAAEDKA
jgi:large subunit ribosomal protein L19